MVEIKKLEDKAYLGGDSSSNPKLRRVKKENKDV